MPDQKDTFELNGTTFEIIKPTRLREGMVLKAGDIFARVGEKSITLEEQIHTESLYKRGFPVSEVLESGDLPNGQWYFTEKSLGTKTFHQSFAEEYQRDGAISDSTFASYLSVVKDYTTAQAKVQNRTTTSVKEFLQSCIPNARVLQNYCYFGHSAEKYQKVMAKVAKNLAGVEMGILQYDFNPFNVLKNGIIDFELVGYGPLGYDGLMSARWGGGWFTDYPSRYPMLYRLSGSQIDQSDALIDEIASATGSPKPTNYLQEFLVIKCAWGASDFNPPQNDWPEDRIAFRRYRVNMLEFALNAYLTGEPIDASILCSIPADKTL